MSNLTVFNFESSEVRVIDIDGQPWFVLSDVLTALNSTTTVTAAKNAVMEGLGEEFVTSQPLLTEGGTQEVTVISEGGITYIVSRSKTDLGKQMNRWIHTEVLPSIRQTGGYISPAANESQLTQLLSKLINDVESIKEQSNSTIKYLQEDITAKNSVITQLTAEKDELNTIFLTYPGLKDAIDYFKLNIDEADNGFSLKTYLASKKINLSHGQRVSVGQLINGWLKVAGNYNLTKYNNCIIYQNKHQQLLDLAICYTLGL